MEHKSKCVITMPRTGSEVLVHYLCGAYNLEYVSELFDLTGQTLPRMSIDMTKRTFRERYRFYNGPLGQLTPDEVYSVALQRAECVKQYEQEFGVGVVVKTFMPTIATQPAILEILNDLFDIVILTRDDVMASAISFEACQAKHFWHGDADASRNVVNNLLREKIQVDEASFRTTLTMHRSLHQMGMRLYPHTWYVQQKPYTWVRYEQYKDDPWTNLNKLFGCDAEERFLPSKFINDQHDKVVANYDQLKSIMEEEFPDLTRLKTQLRPN